MNHYKHIMNSNHYKKLPQDIQFVKDKDEISKVFERVCERYGVKYPTEMVEKLLLDSSGIILDLKFHHNRPRPGQLA